MARLPRLNDKIHNLKVLAESLRAEFGTHLKNLKRNPRLLGPMMERHSPWLAESLRNDVLSAASTLADPYLLGMGIKITDLGEDRIEALLPRRWKNSEGSGDVHVGALLTLAEFAAKIYWERHLVGCQSRVVQMTGSFLRSASRDTKAVFHMASDEREALMFKIRSEKSVRFEHQIPIYDSENQLIAEITIEWRFENRLALASSFGGGVE